MAIMRKFAVALVLLLAVDCSASAADWAGIWKLTSTKGLTYYVTLTKDGGVSSTLEEGFKGTWQEKDGKAYITFASGWKAILSEENGKVTKTAFRPGKDFTDQSDSVTPAERVDAVPNPGATK